MKKRFTGKEDAKEMRRPILGGQQGKSRSGKFKPLLSMGNQGLDDSCAGIRMDVASGSMFSGLTRVILCVVHGF